MTIVDDIKVAITQLSPEALDELRAWYEQFDAQRWDERMVTDIAAGRLDQLAEEALTIAIRPLQHPRHGWEEQFRAMAAAGDDQLLNGDIVALSDWDATEWKW